MQAVDQDYKANHWINDQKPGDSVAFLGREQVMKSMVMTLDTERESGDTFPAFLL